MQVAGSMVKVAAIVLPGVYGPGSTVLIVNCADAEKAKVQHTHRSNKRINFTINTIGIVNIANNKDKHPLFTKYPIKKSLETKVSRDFHFKLKG